VDWHDLHVDAIDRNPEFFSLPGKHPGEQVAIESGFIRAGLSKNELYAEFARPVQTIDVLEAIVRLTKEEHINPDVKVFIEPQFGVVESFFLRDLFDLDKREKILQQLGES